MEASLEPASSSAAAPPQLRGALASEASQGRCAHCDSPTPSTADPYCCTGCRHVHELLQGQGLARYYELRSGRGVPVLDRARSLGEDAWVELELAKLDTSRGLRAVPLDVEGLHCTGCVWLIQEVFHRQACPGNVTVNPALGTLELSIEPGFPLKAFADQLAAFGYRLGPRRKAGERASDDLVWRIGVCVAIAMNAMIFAIARYAGLEGGSLEHVFMWLELGLAVVAFMVGGVVFVRAAWRGLAKRMVHLDLPIAVGLVLGYAGSFAAVLAGKGKGSFFDTLIVFTTLMLVGRFLRERVLEKNRSQLLEDAGIEGLFCRRIEEGEVHVVPVTSIAAGDRLLVAPGDVVPVSALASEAGSFSFDWVTGESEARQVGPGDRVDAGGANAGQVALQLTAEEPFSDSRLLSLLRAPRAAHRYGDSASPFEARVATLWVPAVLAAAAGRLRPPPRPRCRRTRRADRRGRGPRGDMSLRVRDRDAHRQRAGPRRPAQARPAHPLGVLPGAGPLGAPGRLRQDGHPHQRPAPPRRRGRRQRAAGRGARGALQPRGEELPPEGCRDQGRDPRRVPQVRSPAPRSWRRQGSGSSS
jgi:Cu2+-exporting ATPase